jgi:hypothetical protein
MKCLFTVVLCCLSTALYGQQATVSVPIIVTAKNHGSVQVKDTDLTVEVDQQTVAASVVPLAGSHLQYVLLIDQSKTTKWPKGTGQQADIAGQFLKQVIVPDADIGTLINFETNVYLDVQNERDPQELATNLGRIGHGNSGLYDATVSSARWLAKQEANPGYRKVMFLFCDGDDNQSKSNLREAIEALQTKTIAVFIFAPSSVEATERGDNLRRLARETGGRAYFLPSETSRVQFDALKLDLAQSFLLNMSVPSTTGSLRLNVTDAANPHVSIVNPSKIVVPQ